jgi:hypothetical protein
VLINVQEFGAIAHFFLPKTGGIKTLKSEKFRHKKRANCENSAPI